MGMTKEFLVNMGPQHPSTHGVFKVVLALDGETVTGAECVIGYLHRSVEKIAENRTYEQVLPLTDRLDYLNSMGNNLAYVLCIERLADIDPPPRAQIIRIIMAELNRIASHLMIIGTTGLEVGAYSMFLYAFRERERILDLFETASGARLTYSYFRFGGVARDIPETFTEEAGSFIRGLEKHLSEYEDLLVYNPIFMKRTKGIGVLRREQALSYGASGPTLRSTGIDFDIRRRAPYSGYEAFEFDVPIRESGDVWDRTFIRLEEIRQSIRIIEQAIVALPVGDVSVPVPKPISIDPGIGYAAVESPRGELGFFVVSDGSHKPYRMKVRSPAFANLSLAPALLPGHKLPDISLILGSLDPVFGEVDR